MPSTTLTADIIDIEWSTPIETWLYAGSSPGARDYLDSGNLGEVSNAALTNLPVNGSTIFVRLWYRSIEALLVPARGNLLTKHTRLLLHSNLLWFFLISFVARAISLLAPTRLNSQLFSHPLYLRYQIFSAYLVCSPVSYTHLTLPTTPYV